MGSAAGKNAGDELGLSFDAVGAHVTLAECHLVVQRGGRTILNVPVNRIRRVEFDVERQGPATFIIVPDSRGHDVQFLSVESDALETAGLLVGRLGLQLGDEQHHRRS
jgi:hypothetical protein